LRIRCAAEQDRRRVRGEPQDRSVLADDGVEERHFGQQVIEVAEHAPSHEDHQQPGCPRLANGLDRLPVDLTPDGDRAIEIQREDPQVHRSLPSVAPLAGALMELAIKASCRRCGHAVRDGTESS